VVKSPGRINLIGEHTDYNLGFVLPAAIDKAVYVAAGIRTDREVHLYSVNYREFHATRIDTLQPSKHWSAYVLGVIDQLIKEKYPVQGVNLVVAGDIPEGAGLSSSAAVECATLFALDTLFNLNLSKTDMAFMAQRAEHTFAGVQCGIMDMFASLFGQKDCVIKLDCRSLDFEYKSLPSTGFAFLLLNTQVKHSLANSAYNTRRQQCEQAVRWVQAHQPHVQSLRDVTLPLLDEHVKPKDLIVYQRARYVIEENKRLLDVCDALDRGDLPKTGELLYQSHEGLNREYEVSCAELDFLVQQAQQHSGVYGARMMGGGFGGCTLNVIRQDAIDHFVNQVTPRYKKSFALDLTAYIAHPEDGTHLT